MTRSSARLGWEARLECGGPLGVEFELLSHFEGLC